MNIYEILDLARTATRTRSDRALSLRINPANPGLVKNWRNNKSLPSEEHMLILCGIAGIRPEIGLVYLNIWRTGGSTRTTYKRLLKMLGVQELGTTRASKTEGRTATEQMNV